MNRDPDADAAALDIVVLPFYDWKKCEAVGFRTRDGHLIQQLLARPDVRRMLIVGRPSTPLEMLKTRRWWRARNGRLVRRLTLGALVQVHPKAFSLDVFFWDLVRPLRLRLSWWDHALRHRRTLDAVRAALVELDMPRPVVIACTPFSAGPLAVIDASVVVFSADDDWLHHPGVTRSLDRATVERGYDELCRRADVIVANSVALRDVLVQRRPDVAYLPNAVSPELFAGPMPPVPRDLARLPRPWFGYAGTLAPRIDVALLRATAARLPDASFVLLGPIDDRTWIAPLLEVPNIHWLGNKHYRELPAYVRHFDVAMIPHNVGALENRGEAIKLYEYLAAGRPVVTTPIAGVDEFAQHIAIADTDQQFAAALQRYAAMTPPERDAVSQRLRSSLPPSRTWASVTDRVVALIRRHLAGRSARA